MTQEQAQAFVELQGRKAEVENIINALMGRKADLIAAERQLMQSQQPQVQVRPAKPAPTYEEEEEEPDQLPTDTKKKANDAGKPISY